MASRARAVVLAVYTAMAVALLGVVLAATLGEQTKVKDLTRDPATLSGSPASDGLLTWLSAFAWSATITLVLVGAWMLRRLGGSSRRVRFLLWSAVVAAVLTLDDIFLVHERLAPDIGIPEELLFAGYVVGYLVFVREFRDVLVQTEVTLLLVSLGFFSATLLLVFGSGTLDPPFWLLPDTYTFLGVGAWFAYHLHTVITWLEAEFSE